MNAAYRSLFVSRVAAAIGAARAAAAVTQTGVKGTIREILVRDLFRPLLPSDLGIGTGQIATVNNELSPQQDVVIYDRRILPPVLFEETVGIFPVESVLAAIEVKTTLTAVELRAAHDNAKTLLGYSYLSGERNRESGQPVFHAVEKVISAIFALNSDLTIGGKTELERYKELHAIGDPPVRAICVSGRGYWFYSGEWSYVPPDAEHQESLSFIVGLLETFARVGLTRRRPGLVAYLVDDPPIVRGSA
jgi:hypothetical protein